MEKEWIEPIRDLDKTEKLSKALGISPILCSLLVQRQITTYDEAFQFFRPKWESLYDPFLMKGMQEAVERIHEAVIKEEKILLFGDYDVDGTTSVSLMYRFFHSFYPHLDYYLPDREIEGYGVSMKGIKWANENGIRLIISLDCGIKSIKEISLAKELGIDFIICDHHLPDNELPEALILNPKQADCSYPFKHLSGCGIAFKLVQAYQKSYFVTGRVDDLIDLVALSIACDMVEIQDENRILAFYGLKKLNEKPLLGISELFKIAGNLSKNPNKSFPIRFQDILFQIGPRINAAGRMGDAHRVVELLTTEDLDLAVILSIDLNEENLKRRNIEKSITQDAYRMLDSLQENSGHPHRYTNVLFNPDWHKGLVGIVASRVIEKHYAPTIILMESQGKVSGSARSVGSFNIYQAISSCSHLLEQFGGHSAAAGMTMKKEMVPHFITTFEKVVSERLKGKPLRPEVHFHEEISLEEISPKFFEILDQFAPFGPGNTTPLFLTRSLKITHIQRLKETHLKFNAHKNGRSINVIGFGLGELASEIQADLPYDICYHIEMNTFMGKSDLQLILKDIKPSQKVWQN